MKVRWKHPCPILYFDKYFIEVYFSIEKSNLNSFCFEFIKTRRDEKKNRLLEDTRLDTPCDLVDRQVRDDRPHISVQLVWRESFFSSLVEDPSHTPLISDL